MPTLKELHEFLGKEWSVLKSAPFSFFVLAVIGLVTGYVASTWYYSRQIESANAQLAERDSLLSRYRVALGIDKASEGALIELSNQEMKAKAATTSSRLRDLEASYVRRQKALDASLMSADEKTKAERHFRLMKEVSDEFQRTLRADAINVDNELRRRLGPRAVASIVGLPPSFFSASDGAPIGILGLISAGNTGMDAAFMGVLANSIDQMAQLLPNDRHQ